MAITLSGSPQTLTAGYNPMYFYASSDNVAQPNFRYLVSVTNLDTSTVLANLKIKPRFGDNLLEFNTSKIIDNDLGCFSEDIDFNSGVEGFNNTSSTGYNYQIGFGEEYTGNWEFVNILPSSTGGTINTSFFSAVDSGYIAGDTIDVSDAAEAFEFSDNQFDGGALAFVMPTGHTINNGDIITVFQSDPYTYQQYQGEATVVSTSANLITTNKTFAGNTPINGGTLYRNYQYNGLQLVIETGILLGAYYVVIDEPYGDVSTDTTGSTSYYDGRLTVSADTETSDKFVFNGAVGHSDWINWDWNDYSPIVEGHQFLTTLPADWRVRVDNDVYLNIWGNRVNTGTEEAAVKLYDSTGSVIDTFIINNDNEYLSQTEFQNLSMGPRGLNLYHPDRILNGTFQSSSNWTIVDFGGTVTSITGGTLNFSDPTFNGEATVTQSDVLTIGCEYEVTITASANSATTVNIGDESVAVNIVPTGVDGTLTVNFVAQGNDFVITMAAGTSNPAVVTLDDVMVRQLCPVIDCESDIAYYSVQILSSSSGVVKDTEVLIFYLDCACTKYTNYPLLFKDRFGSYVPFNFELNNKQKVNVNKRDTYKKFIGNGGGQTYTYSANERSTSIYNVDINEQWTLNTNWLTEVEAAYFEELVTTPEASILIDDVYHAVIVTDKRYERVRKNNKKNIQYSIKIKFANSNTINV